MTGPFRLPIGGAVDRNTTLRFTFDGRPFTGHLGDTVASALLANGVTLIGRSFKYHRPRGLLAAGVEEPNGLVGIVRGRDRYEPNARATVVPLEDGMAVESQNRSPSLRHDAGAVNDWMSAFLPAGFYYKTFLWPRRYWASVYEPLIRRAAGLGRPPTAADPERYAMRYAHCETLVVGAGPAGLAAALAASQRGGRVVLVEQDEAIGGMLRDEMAQSIDGMPVADWIAQTEAVLQERGVRLLRRTTAFGYGIGNMVALAERSAVGSPGPSERQWLVRAADVVIATGAIERPLVFPNNDRPGVMLASAARAYLRRYGVLIGRELVVVTQHDSGWLAAVDLAAAGARVTIAEARGSVPSDIMAAARHAGVTVLLDARPIDTRGRRHVVSVRVAVSGRNPIWLRCDALLMAGGWTPSVHLHSQSGGKVVWDEPKAAFVPGGAPQPQISAGACRGHYGLASCLADGWRAGGGHGLGPAATDAPSHGLGPADPPRHAEGARHKAFVDFQNDVTAKDIRLAVREGFQSVEHLKRYTTNGMATDQGRTSNINALAIAAQVLGVSIPKAGLTTFRAPFTPVTFGTMAGHARGLLFEPVRTTPMHGRAVAAGAVFEDVGQWKRARAFPQQGETLQAAVVRECRAVRERAALFDASTLGKLEVVGPDAAVFLDLLYTGRLSSLAVGRCRYALMLREDGFILDDGVVSRIAIDRFHITTTSGGFAAVLAVMEDFRQTEWPELRVWLTATTEQWATIAVNGPNARDLIRPLVGGINLDAFPHMSVAVGSLSDIPLRLCRVSFTGELGYELNVPASHGTAAWDLLVRAGRPFDATLYGTDASHVLRAEKGYIIVGQETDGTATPDDVGLGKMVAMSKTDFVGKRSLLGDAMKDPDRKQLVGLIARDGEAIDEGMQVIDPSAPRTSIGHVSSAYRRTSDDAPFALAMVRGGRRLVGTTLALATDGEAIAVDVVDPVFHDPEGVRLRA